MKPTKILQAAAITLSSAGLIFPQTQVLAAAPQAKPAANSTEAAAPAIFDVTLARGGVLRGQVVDAQGQPVANAPLTVLYEGKEIANTKTVADGSFAVNGLRGGTHVVKSGDNGGVFRMWAAETAPPSAGQGVMIVRGGTIARGQGFASPAGLLMLAGLGGIIAGGVVSQDSDNNGHGSGS